MIKQLTSVFSLRNSKFNFIAILLILSRVDVNAQEVINITLQQAVAQTLANNQQIKQAQFQASISEESLKQSNFERYPNLTSSASANRQFGLFFDQQTGRLINSSVDQVNGRLSSSVLLFGGGSLVNQIKQNKNFLLADQTNVDRIKNDLSLTVVTTFLEAINNKDLIKASEDQLKLSSQQLDAAKRRFEVGSNTQADLSQSTAQVATNELNLANAQNAFDLSILNLKQLMEMDPQKEINLVTPAIDDINQISSNYNANEVYSQALAIQPDIKRAAYNSEAFKYGIEVAKGNLYPSLSFGAGLSTGYSSANPLSFQSQITDSNFGQFVGFNLQIPIFNNYRQRSAYNISKIRYENAKASEQLAKNNLNKIVNQAVLDLKSALKSYQATKSAFESSKLAFNVLQQRYDVGLANIIELNTSQTNYNKAEFDFIQAKYNVLFRSKVIDFYLGKPLTL